MDWADHWSSNCFYDTFLEPCPNTILLRVGKICHEWNRRRRRKPFFIGIADVNQKFRHTKCVCIRNDRIVPVNDVATSRTLQFNFKLTIQSTKLLKSRESRISTASVVRKARSVNTIPYQRSKYKIIRWRL